MEKKIKEKIKTIELRGSGKIEGLTLDKRFFKKLGKGLKLKGKDFKLGKLVKIRPFESSIGGSATKNLSDIFSEKPIDMSSESSKNDLQGYMAEYEKGFLVVESDGEYIDMMIIKK